MNELDLLRQKINQLDAELINLLSLRSNISQEVAEYKAKNGLPIYQPQREEELFSRIRTMAAEKGLDPDYIESIFRLIIENSKKLQLKTIA